MIATVLHDSGECPLQPGGLWRLPGPGGEYRDAPASEVTALVASIEAGRPWREAVAALYRDSRPWLHRIISDPSRDLFLRIRPPAPGSRVLDVGAGWGQAALPLARHCRVVALEPTPERLAFVRAVARQEGLDRSMAFVEAPLQSVGFRERFDLITCIGVLEWVPRFAEGDPCALQADFLARLRSLLAPGGRLVVGIENRLGLKYLLGARDDHTGLSGVSCLDRESAQRRHLELTGEPLRCLTYSLSEYEALFRDAGLRGFSAHAAWPDYKLPALVLPVGPALEEALRREPPPAEHDGYSGDALPAPLQEALRSHYSSLAAQGAAGGFAPSYFLEGFAP